MRANQILQTIYDRIEWLRKHPRDRSRRLGAKQFGLACGLSGGWLAGLGTRTAKRPDGVVDVPVSLETARKVSAHTGASEEWIMTGGGEPFERYPERVEALAAYREIPAEVRARVEAMRFHAQDRPSVARWRAHIDVELAAFHRGETVGIPLDAPDDLPPENQRRSGRE